MTSEQSEATSPFARPRFLIAASVIITIIVIGVALTVVNLAGRDDAAATAATVTPTATTTPAPSTTAGVDDTSESICGLDGVELSGRITVAPDAEWLYQGTTAYPASDEYGPAATDSESGYRYCFQHSPEGALFMAASAFPQGSDDSMDQDWIEYALSDGPLRDEWLGSTGDEGTTSSSTGTRDTLTGFRLLEYTGDAARVDLAIYHSSATGEGLISAVYELIWQDGDWKIDATAENPIDVASIPSSAGYISWGG